MFAEEGGEWSDDGDDDGSDGGGDDEQVVEVEGEAYRVIIASLLMLDGLQEEETGVVVVLKEVVGVDYGRVVRSENNIDLENL